MSTAAALLGVLRGVKTRLMGPSGKVHIENFTFRLFCKVSVVILFVSSALVTIHQTVGKPIECIVNSGVREKAVNQYCFVTSTYTLPHLYNISDKSSKFFHHGVGPFIKKKHEQRFHRYYQWVPFALFFQALSFSIPHFIWKKIEDGQIAGFAHFNVFHGTNEAPVRMQERSLLTNKSSRRNVELAAWAFFERIGENAFYAGGYIFCEFLNVVIIFLNICLTERFLGGGFTSYGPDVVTFMFSGTTQQEDTNFDPMSRLFPKVGKCDFRMYGPSGSIVTYDALCVLAMNVVNEKVYAFMWFWFMFLAVMGCLNLVYRFTIWVFGPKTWRNWIIRQYLTNHHEQAAWSVLKQLSYSDALFLRRISVNINRSRLGEFVLHLDSLVHGRCLCESCKEKREVQHDYDHGDDQVTKDHVAYDQVKEQV